MLRNIYIKYFLSRTNALIHMHNITVEFYRLVITNFKNNTSRSSHRDNNASILVLYKSLVTNLTNQLYDVKLLRGISEQFRAGGSAMTASPHGKQLQFNVVINEEGAGFAPSHAQTGMRQFTAATVSFDLVSDSVIQRQYVDDS